MSDMKRSKSETKAVLSFATLLNNCPFARRMDDLCSMIILPAELLIKFCLRGFAGSLDRAWQADHFYMKPIPPRRMHVSNFLKGSSAGKKKHQV